jgi:PAS domain S-box-containing protein
LLRLFLLAAVLSLVLFLTLRGLVIRPLSTLKAWVENLPRGTELKPPRFKRSGEINALGEAFGKLSFNLQKKHDELESEHALLQQLFQRMHVQIEERKQAERRASELAYFLNKMREAVIVTDLENRFIYWNEGAQNTFGWSADEVMGKVADDLFPEGPMEALEVPRRAVKETGEWHGELPNIDRQGRTFFTESSWTLVRNAAVSLRRSFQSLPILLNANKLRDALRVSEARFSRYSTLARIAWELCDCETV